MKKVFHLAVLRRPMTWYVRTHNKLPCFLFCCTLSSGSLSADRLPARTLLAWPRAPSWGGLVTQELSCNMIGTLRKQHRSSMYCVCVWGGTGPRFTQISLLLLLLTCTLAVYNRCTGRILCTQLSPSDNVTSCCATFFYISVCAVALALLLSMRQLCFDKGPCVLFWALRDKNVLCVVRTRFTKSQLISDSFYNLTQRCH